MGLLSRYHYVDVSSVLDKTLEVRRVLHLESWVAARRELVVKSIDLHADHQSSNLFHMAGNACRGKQR